MDLKYEPLISDGTRKNYVHSKYERRKLRSKKLNNNLYIMTSMIASSLIISMCLFTNTNFVLADDNSDIIVSETSSYIAENDELQIEPVIDTSLEMDLDKVYDEERIAKAKEMIVDSIIVENADFDSEVVANGYISQESIYNELLNKYSYALYDTNGNRNDITPELLMVLEDACAQWNVNPHLMMGIIMTESEGHSNAKSSKSTATGLCQILKGTGKWIYEDILKNGKGTYSHSMAYNPELNIRMGVAYMGTLLRDKGSTHRALQKYRGKNDISAYVGRINSFIGKAGLSVSSI